MPDDDSHLLLSCSVDVLGMGACASVCQEFALHGSWPLAGLHMTCTLHSQTHSQTKYALCMLVCVSLIIRH